MPEIHVGLIEEAILKQVTGSDGKPTRILDYKVPFGAPVINYERKQSLFFFLEAVEKLRVTGEARVASHENPLMTPSAGAISFFLDENGERRYISLCQKDMGAPRDPGFLVARNGYPQAVQHWSTLDHLAHEAFEEGIFIADDAHSPESAQYSWSTLAHLENRTFKKGLFITKSGNLLLPNNDYAVHDPHSGAAYNLSQIIERAAENLERYTNIKIRGTARANIQFNDGKDMLVSSVQFEKDGEYKTAAHRGVISWSPESGFNFLKYLDVQYPLEELWLVDAETFPNGKPICRDVALMDLANLQGKVFGNMIQALIYHHDGQGHVTATMKDMPFLTDKVPRSLLSQTTYQGKPIYPIDWMEESYDFLKKIPPAKLNFAYSSFEKEMKVGK